MEYSEVDFFSHLVLVCETKFLACWLSCLLQSSIKCELFLEVCNWLSQDIYVGYFLSVRDVRNGTFEGIDHQVDKVGFGVSRVASQIK